MPVRDRFRFDSGPVAYAGCLSIRSHNPVGVNFAMSELNGVSVNSGNWRPPQQFHTRLLRSRNESFMKHGSSQTDSQLSREIGPDTRVLLHKADATEFRAVSRIDLQA
jgi:hypothetical protein